MTNKQDFNELSADLFSKLYDSFPVGIDVNIKDYPSFDSADRSDIFFSTIKFYINEGFIRSGKQYYGGFGNLVLTSKGFTVLNEKPPENFSKRSSIAAALNDAAQTGKTEIIKGLVSETIKFALKYAIN